MGRIVQRFQACFLARWNASYERYVADRKRKLFADISGTVLEIGPGTGTNLAYLPEGIHWIGLEPNPYMHPYLRREAERLQRRIEIQTSCAEAIEREDQSIDAVICTLVLCSVRDVPGTLQEIRRVLKPGGSLRFIEHVAAERGTGERRIQRCIHPLWKWVTDGCHTDRETEKSLKEAGFQRLELDHFRVPYPIIAPHIAGCAFMQE
jgi:ubiquinone/menaquinone biosynthesis C-methylase UbiE